MNELPIQHATASRWATIMLGAAVLAVALTLGVFVLPRPEVRAPELKADQSAAAPKAPRRLPWEGVATDWSRAAADLEKVNAPDIEAWKKDVAEQQRRAAEERSLVAGPNGEPATPPESGGFAPNWRFLGAVIDGERRTALVVIPEPDGAQRQRFVSVGFVKDEYKVVAIEPTKLVLEQGRRKHELKLAASQRGQGITTGSTTPPNRPVIAGGAPAPGQPNRIGVQDRVRDLRQPNRALGATGNGNPYPGMNPAANPNSVPVTNPGVVPGVNPGEGAPSPVLPPQPGAEPMGDFRQPPAEPESGIN